MLICHQTLLNMKEESVSADIDLCLQTNILLLHQKKHLRQTMSNLSHQCLVLT